MVLKVPISAEAEKRLNAKAAAAGVDAETFAARTLEQALTRSTLDEVLAPLREEFEASGMSEEELVDLLERAKHEQRAERRAPRVVSARHVIFDCNVFLQIMVNTRGAAHACWQKVVVGELSLHVTVPIIEEIRRLPDHRSVKRFRRFTPEKVDRFLAELLRLATFDEDPPATFSLSRDPDDSHYLNVAIASGAMLVVSNDRDLLDLMDTSSADGVAIRARYPNFQVVTPVQLLAELRS